MLEDTFKGQYEQSVALQRIQVGMGCLENVIREGSVESSERLQAAVTDLAEKIETAKKAESWKSDPLDPFSFSATIIKPHEDDVAAVVARGELDSGCENDWISTEIVKRAKLEGEIARISDPTVYTAFGGQTFQPHGIIDITWYATNAGVSRTTSFLVHDAVPFDIVLGKIFIRDESIFVFSKPALALRQGKFTKEELREIEKNAKDKNASNEQIAAIRRTTDGAARDRLRKQKASSRSTAATTPGTMSPNSWSRPAQNLLAGSSLSRSLTIQSSQSQLALSDQSPQANGFRQVDGLGNGSTPDHYSSLSPVRVDGNEEQTPSASSTVNVVEPSVHSQSPGT
ncbi:hypothetical protein B0J14DRAFT_661092 [Halenospora varia]|nr:hypothetical protein B0J14DRAFT_661092 [Halenospora varia]